MAAKKAKTGSPRTLEQQKAALLRRLSARDRRFVNEYLAHNNARRAYFEASGNCSITTAGTQGYRLLKRDDIRAVIDLHREITIRDLGMEHDEIARRLWQTYSTPATEIIQHRRPPCRYCYGKGHEYQWRTPREFRAARDKAISKFCAGLGPDERAQMIEAINSGAIEDADLPEDVGGYGYDATMTPNGDCPECNGLGGAPITTITDTDLMSDGALLLYDGVKETQHGIEVKLLDRMAALDKLAKHLGMFAGKVESDEINPLEALARRMMAGAQTVPVVPDPPAGPAGFALEPHESTDETAHDAPPDPQEDDGYVEP